MRKNRRLFGSDKARKAFYLSSLANPSSPAKELDSSLEERASEAGYERAQLKAKLAENAKVIRDLQRELARQRQVVDSLKVADMGVGRALGSNEPVLRDATDANAKRAEK